MNLYILLGIVAIAVGTALLTYGGIITSRKDAAQASVGSEAKLASISRDLAELKGKPKSDLSPESILRVEGEVKEWALNFASERQQRKLATDQKRTELAQKLTHANSLAKEYFAYVLKVLNDTLVAYS